MEGWVLDTMGSGFGSLKCIYIKHPPRQTDLFLLNIDNYLEPILRTLFVLTQPLCLTKLRLQEGGKGKVGRRYHSAPFGFLIPQYT